MSLTNRDRIATIAEDLRTTARRLLEIADQLDMLAGNMRVMTPPKEKL